MNEHYYASSVYGWATSNTKQGALAKLAQDVGPTFLKRLRDKSEHKGLFAQVVRVELPQAAHYTINGFLPSTITKEDGVNETRKGERVPLGEVEKVIVTTMDGKHRAYQPE